MPVCLASQVCLTLCDPMGCSPPGSSVPVISRAWILEWVASSSSRGIFPTQRSTCTPCLPHCRQILYRLSHRGIQPLGKVSATEGLATVSNSNACVCHTSQSHWMRTGTQLSNSTTQVQILAQFLCGLGQVAATLCASASFSVRGHEDWCSANDARSSGWLWQRLSSLLPSSRPRWGRSSHPQGLIKPGSWVWRRKHWAWESWRSPPCGLEDSPSLCGRSAAQPHPALCHPRDGGTPGFPVLCLPELAQSHVRWAGDAIQPPHHLSPPSPPALNLSQHQGFSHESALHIRWPKYWSFSFRINSSKEYSGWFPLGWTGLISLLSKGLCRARSLQPAWDLFSFSSSPPASPSLPTILGWNPGSAIADERG